MKKLKRPTRSQKKAMTANGLNPAEWLTEREISNPDGSATVTVINAATKEQRVITREK